MSSNLYEILGVDKNATEDEIKKAYFKKAKTCHPDKFQTEPDEVKKQKQQEFQQINQAYEVLKDPSKRHQYDETGTIGEQPEMSNGPDLASLFGSMFGGMGGMFGGMGGMSSGPEVKPIELTIREMFDGCTKKIHTQRHRVMGRNGSQIQMAVENIIKDVVIPPKQYVGAKIVIPEAGSQNPRTSKFDDLVLIVQEKPDVSGKWKCQGKNLHYKQKITFMESICGYVGTITHFDGRVITFKTEIVTNGSSKCIKGEGMGNLSAGMGDLIIDFEVEPLTSLTSEQRNELKRVFKYEPRSVDKHTRLAKLDDVKPAPSNTFEEDMFGTSSGPTGTHSSGPSRRVFVSSGAPFGGMGGFFGGGPFFGGFN